MLRHVVTSPARMGRALSGANHSMLLVGASQSIMKTSVFRTLTGHWDPATKKIDCGAGRKCKRLWTMSIRVPNPIEPSPTFLHSLAHLIGGGVGELKRRRPVFRTLLSIVLASAFSLGFGYWFVEETMKRESKSRKWWTMEPFGTAESDVEVSIEHLSPFPRGTFRTALANSRGLGTDLILPAEVIIYLRFTELSTDFNMVCNWLKRRGIEVERTEAGARLGLIEYALTHGVKLNLDKKAVASTSTLSGSAQ